MEDRTRTPSEVGNEALFSERFRLWLDEGERLEAETAAAPESAHALEPPSDHGPLRRLFTRHRLGVMAGMGLLPLALFVALHRGSVPPATPPVASAAPVVAPPSPPVAPPPASPPPTSPVAAAEAPEAVAESEAGAGPGMRQGRRHHHRHHHHSPRHRSAFHR